jgi:hypothetical protein
MILSDREVQAAIRDGIILIDPQPEEGLYSSTALDLTLDSVLLRWNEPGNHPSGQPIRPRRGDCRPQATGESPPSCLHPGRKPDNLIPSPPDVPALSCDHRFFENSG